MQGLGPRFVLEVVFLIALAIGVGVAELSATAIIAVMALAWLLKDSRVTSVLTGASRVEQLEDSVRALGNFSFSAEELAEIDRHAKDSGVDLWERSRQS